MWREVQLHAVNLILRCISLRYFYSNLFWGFIFFPLLPIVLSSLSTLISRCLAVTASSPIMDGAVDQRQAVHGCHRLVHDSAELCISCAQGVATVW